MILHAYTYRCLPKSAQDNSYEIVNTTDLRAASPSFSSSNGYNIVSYEARNMYRVNCTTPSPGSTPGTGVS